MSNSADASAAQVPEIGSDEWVAQTLKARGIQGEQPDEPDDVAVESQGATPDATNAQEQVEPQGGATPDWRQTILPDDDTVPKRFRGRPAVEAISSYTEFERSWHNQQARIRELEARVAAKDTLHELLAEQRAVASPPAPADPYRDAGIDPETDAVLNPTKFHQFNNKLVLQQAQALVAEELAKRDAEYARQQEETVRVNRMSAALGQIEKQRGLTEAQMKQRLPSIMMTAAETLGQEALSDPEKLLQIHDSIFGYTAPVAVTTQSVPNPPGIKRPAAVEPSPKSNGLQLKQYEREILGQLAEDIESSGVKLDPEKLMARYAMNLKRARG